MGQSVRENTTRWPKERFPPTTHLGTIYRLTRPLKSVTSFTVTLAKSYLRLRKPSSEEPPLFTLRTPFVPGQGFPQFLEAR